MSELVNKIKKYVTKSSTTERPSYMEDIDAMGMFSAAMELLDKYRDVKNSYKNLDQSQISDENDIKGLESYLTQTLIKMIDKNDNITMYNNSKEQSYTLGMYAAKLGLEKVALRTMDNPHSLNVINDTYQNIGMVGCLYGLESVALKALDYPLARTVQDSEEKTLGMYCADAGFETATLKALDFEDSYLLQDNENKNILMHCFYNNKKPLIEPLKKAFTRRIETSMPFDNGYLPYRELLVQTDRLGYNVGSYLIQNLKFVKDKNEVSDYENMILESVTDDELATNQDILMKYNNGMLAASIPCKPYIISRAILNKQAALQQDYKGDNIAMNAAKNCVDASVIKLALQNPESCRQQNEDGDNLGMLCAKNKYPREILTPLLKDGVVCTQMNNEEYNMGMLCVLYDAPEDVVTISLENEFARSQQDKDGDTIGLLAAKFDLHEAAKSALDYTDSSFIKNNNGESLFDYIEITPEDANRIHIKQVMSMIGKNIKEFDLDIDQPDTSTEMETEN